MKHYPSNITGEEFEIIRKDLEGAKKQTKPRQVDRYDVFCAILYVLKSGCQWDMLPSDFPQKSTLFYYFQTWTKSRDGEGTLLEDVLKNWPACGVPEMEGANRRIFVSSTPGVFKTLTRRRKEAVTVDIRAGLLPTVSEKPLALMLRLLSATIGADSQSSPDAGLWSDLLAGLINAAGFGKTANANAILLVKWWFLLLSLYCLKDLEQTLRRDLQKALKEEAARSDVRAAYGTIGKTVLPVLKSTPTVP